MKLQCPLRIVLCLAVAACLCRSGRAQQQSPDSAGSVQSLLQQGRAAAERGDVTGARSAFDQVTRLQPDNAQAVLEQGTLLASLGQVRAAESFFRRSTELDPGSAKAHFMLGLSLVADPATRLDWPAAIQQFRTALRLQPNYPEASARLGRGLLAMDDPASAVAVLREAIASSPHSAMLLTQLGKACEATQQQSQAAVAYRQAVAIDPHEADAAVALARLLIAGGHAEEAVQVLHATLRLNPDLQPAQYVLARALKKVGQPQQAAAALAASARLAQKDSDAAEAKRLSNAALQEAAAHHFAEAENDLHKAIRLRPDYGIAHYNLGLILADQRRLVDAQHQLIQAVSLLPGQAKPLFDLGRVELLLGNVDGARREQQWAAQLQPSLQPAQGSLTVSGTAQGVSAALSPLPSGWSDTVAAHQQLAEGFSAAGDHLGAAGQMQRAVELAPGVANLRVALARELAAAGDPEGAKVENNNARLIDPSLSAIP